MKREKCELEIARASYKEIATYIQIFKNRKNKKHSIKERATMIGLKQLLRSAEANIVKAKKLKKYSGLTRQLLNHLSGTL